MEGKVKVKVKSCLTVTPWTVAHQAPPSMGSYRQEYWNGLPFPSPGDLPHPGIKPTVSHEVRRRGQGASRGAPGKSGLHASGEGERVIAPEPWHR